MVGNDGSKESEISDTKANSVEKNDSTKQEKITIQEDSTTKKKSKNKKKSTNEKNSTTPKNAESKIDSNDAGNNGTTKVDDSNNYIYNGHGQPPAAAK